MLLTLHARREDNSRPAFSCGVHAVTGYLFKTRVSLTLVSFKDWAGGWGGDQQTTVGRGTYVHAALGAIAGSQASGSRHKANTASRTLTAIGSAYNAY